MNKQIWVTLSTATMVSAVLGCSSSTELTAVGQNQTGEDQLVDMANVHVDVVDETTSIRTAQELMPTSRLASETRQPTVTESKAMAEDSALMPSPRRHTGVIVDTQHVAEDRENYQQIENNRIMLTANEATSTFSIDVDTGAYANMRRFLNGGSLPPEDAIRIEELINYFSYDYAPPEAADQPFSITTEIAKTPWNDQTHLLHVGLQGYQIDAAERPAANLVFLIDVSGSMSAPNKLALLKPAMRMLSQSMTAADTISIVVYAGASGVVLEPTAGNDIQAIHAAINQLNAGGSTNGRAGIELAYDMAAKNFQKQGINRVILATDGDFNVGLSDVDALKALIEAKRESGVALSTLGFGTGNYNDHLMEQLADVGNGAYAYIDTLNEARKVLSDEINGTLLTIAKDVKIQIEFNPAVVSEYRLIGYENRHLNNEDFNNDKIDAGEIGAGHSVTAIYEIALVGSGGERHTPTRYSKSAATEEHVGEIAELRLRFKAPQEDDSQLLSQVVMLEDIVQTSEESSTNFRFSAAVAAMGQLLRDDQYMNEFDLDDVAGLAAGAKGADQFGYRQEFTNLVRLAKALGGTKQAKAPRSPDDSQG